MKKQPLVTKILLMLTLILLIPISLTTVFSSRSILRNAEEEIGEFNSKYLKSMSQSIDVMVDSLIETATHTTLSDKISQLGFLPERDVITDGAEAVVCLNAYNLINELVMVNRSLYSVYLYLEDSKYIIVSNIGTIDINQFSDVSWLKDYGLKKNQDTIVWLNTRKINNSANPYDKQKDQYVITFLCPLKSYVSNIKGTLVFNIKEEAFSRLFDAFERNTNSMAAIINTGKYTIAARDKDDIGNIYEASYLNDIYSCPLESGYLVTRNHNSSTLVSFYKSDFENWIYLGETSLTSLMTKAQSLVGKGIAFNFILAFLALFIASYFAIRYSSPLNLLISDIRKKVDQNSKGNDISLLTRTFNRLLSEENQLNRLLEEKQVDCRHKEIYNRMMGRPTEESCGLNGDMSVAIILIDQRKNFTKRYKPDQQFYVKNMIMEFCAQLSLPKMETVTMLLEHGEMAVIFANIDDINDVKACLLSLKENVQSTLGLSLTIGLSRIGNAPEGIQAALLEAIDASKMRFLIGYGQTILYSQLPSEKYFYPFLQEKQLLDALLINDKSAVKNAASEFFETVRHRKNLTVDNVMQILSQLAGVILKYMSQNFQNANKIIPAETNIFVLIGSAETLDEAYDVILNILLLIVDDRAGKIEDENYIEKILSYIKSNYTKDFGIDELAGSIGLSYSHTRRLFKAKFGNTIVEYLNQYRIDKAKKLLSDMNQNITEIPELVGYNNNQSFYRFFKKYVGVTPREYRRKIFFQNKTS